MDPKKTILLYCGDSNERIELEFKLRIWGYDVTSTSELCLMPAALRSKPADLVLLRTGCERREFQVIAQELEILQWAALGSIRIYDPENLLAVNVAPSIFRIQIVPVNAPAYLREQLKIIMHRKRGPRKATQPLAVCA